MVAQDAHDPHGNDPTARVHAHAAPTRLHSQVHFQPGPQGHRASVLLSGADRGVCRDVSVAADAHPHDLADGESAADGRDQAGNLPQPADHARHHHGVLRADHGAPGRLRQLLSAHPDRRAGYGVSRPEHAFVLDHLHGVRGHPRRLLRHRRRSRCTAGRATRRSAPCPAPGPASNWAPTCGSPASRSSASPR